MLSIKIKSFFKSCFVTTSRMRSFTVKQSLKFKIFSVEVVLIKSGCLNSEAQRL